jgi:RNA polymerase sigma-70 factor, ECF subfamily
MTATEEKTLIRSALAGDHDAFTALYRATKTNLFGLLFALTRNHEDAEDLTAEVFSKAFLKLDKFRGSSRLSTWLYRIGRNAFLMEVRRRRSVVGRAIHGAISLDCPNDIDQLPVGALAYTDYKQRGVEARELPARLTCLSPRMRTVLVLRVVYGLTNEETACATGVTRACIKRDFHRVKQRARLVLKDFQCS